MIAQIAVSAANFAIDKPYSYYVPAHLSVLPGHRVIVPFGKGNRKVEGIVLGLQAEDAQPKDVKPVCQILDEEPLVSDTMLRLASFMRRRYFCTFYEAVRTMLPAGLWFKTQDTYSLTQDRSWKTVSFRQADAAKILEMLEDAGGSADAKILEDALGHAERFAKAIAYLLRKKWISGQTDYCRRAADKVEQVVTLAASCEEAMEYAARRPKSALMQKNVLELLCSVGSASVKEVCYFTGASAATVRRLAELGFVALSDREVLRCRHIEPAKLDGPLVLTPEQKNVFDAIENQRIKQDPGVALLYGVTGSGKTSVYIKLIERCVAQGKQAVLLVPEIALTPQLLGLMVAYFGETVAVQHSSLPATERYDQWKRIRSGQAKVVIGTRSAVFAPCQQLGVMILDEEQEHSYKSENAPRYGAREIAMWRGLREHALVLLGSATPSVESMYHARQGEYTLYTLANRYNQKPLPPVSIVDMRQELQMGNDRSFSLELQDAIRQTSNAGEQTILFLNRRGNARALVCVDCRKSPECPRCSARLTYHSANERLMCHYCGHSEPVPSRCACGGHLKTVGTGTQKVQQELETVFSDLKVLRMDADTVSASNTHQMILERFQEEKIPILIGTQMVAKGLDLKNVTLVGVLDADLSLYTENFRAAETTFNMLTQVVGRAGRGHVQGRAVIQTLVPGHRVIELAARQDYDGFYELELQLRRVQKLPPFGDLAVVKLTGQDEAQVLRGAAKFRDSLRSCLKDPRYEDTQCTVLGPAPCPVSKINHHFRYQLTLRCHMTDQLRHLIAHLLRQFLADRTNRGVSAFVDVNGFE